MNWLMRTCLSAGANVLIPLVAVYRNALSSIRTMLGLRPKKTDDKDDDIFFASCGGFY